MNNYIMMDLVESKCLENLDNAHKYPVGIEQ